MTTSRNSLVAYFDILGYQSFLKTNSALETAEKVFELVKESPKLAIKTWCGDENFVGKDDELKKIAPSIQSLVFSDTIVISCPVMEANPSEKQVAMIGSISLSV